MLYESFELSCEMAVIIVLFQFHGVVGLSRLVCKVSAGSVAACWNWFEPLITMLCA